MSKPARLRNKEYGTIVRIIRTYSHGKDLYWVCRDETYGGLCHLSVDQFATGAWEVVE